MLNYALFLARSGFHVLPLHTPTENGCSCRHGELCPSPGKHPRTGRGVKDASNDPEQIKEWWGKWSDANIGIATGPQSDCVVVDIDPRHGGEVPPELPETLRVVTGSGGEHLYFRPPEGVRVKNHNRGEIFGSGVDIKSGGGYVVAPPSLHSCGGRYVWADQRDMALFPKIEDKKVRAKRKRKKTQGKVVSRAALELTDSPHIRERLRGDAWDRAMGAGLLMSQRLRRAPSWEEIRDFYLEWGLNHTDSADHAARDQRMRSVADFVGSQYDSGKAGCGEWAFRPGMYAGGLLKRAGVTLERIEEVKAKYDRRGNVTVAYVEAVLHFYRMNIAKRTHGNVGAQATIKYIRELKRAKLITGGGKFNGSMNRTVRLILEDCGLVDMVNGSYVPGRYARSFKMGKDFAA